MTKSAGGTAIQSSEGIKKRFRVDDLKTAVITVLFGVVGAVLFALIHSIPMPFTMVSLLKFGLYPALAIIAVLGAIRGPLAGFLSGYFGIVLYDLLFFNTVVSMTLPALAYGMLGLVVGLATYNLANGRSLAKLSLLSAVGLVFTACIAVMFGLFIDQHSVLLELGFVMLPLFTVGLPSVVLITPIYARIWQIISMSIQTS